MIDTSWFYGLCLLGLLGLVIVGLSGGLARGDGLGAMPLHRPAVLAAVLVGGGLGGLVAADLFQVYPRELLLGSSFTGALCAALATSYALW